jgi:hypothetical protein
LICRVCTGTSFVEIYFVPGGAVKRESINN